jgi:hypothetical protein
MACLPGQGQNERIEHWKFAFGFCWLIPFSGDVGNGFLAYTKLMEGSVFVLLIDHVLGGLSEARDSECTLPFACHVRDKGASRQLQLITIVISNVD